MTTPTPNVGNTPQGNNLQNTGTNPANVVNQSPSLQNQGPSTYDPSNPPEFNPNAEKPKITKKHAISGMGIAIILVGIVLLGFLVGKVISLFTEAGVTTPTNQCKVDADCSNEAPGGGKLCTYGEPYCDDTVYPRICRCPAPTATSTPTPRDQCTKKEDCTYAPDGSQLCKDKDAAYCDTSANPNVCRCKYTPTDTPKPNSCGPASSLTTAQNKAASQGNAGRCTCVGNNPFCCYTNSNGEKKCILAGNWGIKVAGKDSKCPAPFNWGPRLEYGQWWCFDTSKYCLPQDYTISGRCDSDSDGNACTPEKIDKYDTTPPSACFTNPTQPPTGTSVDTPTPTDTPTTTPTDTPTETPTPTPGTLACMDLSNTNTNNTYRFTCQVTDEATACKFVINNSETHTSTPVNNTCTYDHTFTTSGDYSIRCYAVDANNAEASSDACINYVNIPNGPTTTPPSTGIFDSPASLASLTIFVFAIAIFETFTGYFTNLFLNTKARAGTLFNAKDLKITIKLSKNSKVRKALESRLTKKIKD